MPGARTASRRIPALQASEASSSSSSASSSSPSSPITPEAHLLTHANNVRKCCDMSLFYKNLQEQGLDFIADSLLHANDIFAKYATSSRTVASPSKLAGELLKSPTRTRTRSRDVASATGRTRSALASNSDPFWDAADVFDKENAPIPTRASRSRAASAMEPEKGRSKAKAQAAVAIEVTASEPPVRSTRKVLGDLNAQKKQTKSSDPPKRLAVQKATSKVSTAEDDSMAIDSSIRVEAPRGDSIPRASTPPTNTSAPKVQAAQAPTRAIQAAIETISIVDSDEDDSDDEAEEQEHTALSEGELTPAMRRAEPTVTSPTVSQDAHMDSTVASSHSDTNDSMRSTHDRTKELDSTLSGALIDPKLDSARQTASALLATKLQQQKGGNTEKPAKRTLASYGAKKSLSAATHNARPSNTTLHLHSASTPAGPGFRSSFLNKSLRKQIADQEALESSDESDSDSDTESHALVAGSASAAVSKKTAANTRANAGDATTKMAQLLASGAASARKRKSDVALPAASDGALGSSAPPAKMSKLGAATLEAKPQPSAPAPAAKKAPAVGPASKLEQFRSNLAHVARSTGSGASASSASHSGPSTVSAISSTASAASQPTASFKTGASAPAQTALPLQAEDHSDVHSTNSDSSLDVTEKLASGNRSGESTIKASAIPRSPTRSPSRAAAASPVKLPPRTGSVRKSPRKLAEQLKANQKESARSASPGPKSREKPNLSHPDMNGASSDVPTPRSPTTQPRSLAALFGSPKQGSKLPSLSSTAGGSTTPAHSPPKNWHGSRLPFAQPLAFQQQSSREKDKSLPQTPIEEHAEPLASVAGKGNRAVSAASTVHLTSKSEQESQFFDARSRENSPEPAETGTASLTTRAPEHANSIGSGSAAAKLTAAAFGAPGMATSTKASGIAKAPAISPKKVAAKALAKTGPTSPTKASALRAAANAGSPSKAKTQSTTRTAPQSNVQAASTSPSRSWGIGEKIKGFLGLHASTTTNSTTSAAQTKISASSAFQPRSNVISASASTANAAESKAASYAATSAPALPTALLASPTPSSKTPQVQSTPSSGAASTGTNSKLTSIARAEMLRKKQAEEEERKAKEKEERRRMLLAKKEERAKAMAEEELEKENRKRAREQNDRPGRAGTANEDASIASSSGAPAAIPAALLGGIVVGSTAPSSVHSGSMSSRTSAVSTVSSGPPTRPSSALNGSYAGVKSRYMQTGVQLPQQASQDESNKKRRVTNDRDGASAAAVPQPKSNPQPAVGARPGVSAATSQIGAPKLVRTISQSSIRAGPTSQAPAQQQQLQQQGMTSQRAQPQPAPQQIKLTMKPGAAAAAGFGAAPRIPGAGAVAGSGAATASMMAAASKAPLASGSNSSAPKTMANANFSSSNPFQQAKQQQLQLQMQKQIQMQMLQQQQQQAQAAASASQAHAAAMREQELHRAAQMQFQMQNAAGGRAEEWDDRAGEGGADEALPDIASEYSDSEDEETIQKRAAMPSWTQGEALDAALLAQSTVDADEIFGIPQGPVELEKILPGERTANRIRRPRTSSANWSGPDGLAQWEIDRYNKRMGIKGAGVQLINRDGSHHAPPPPALLRLSMANRQSSAASSSLPKKDDARSKP